VRSGDHPAVWIEIHAAEQFRTPGASQDVTELVRRLIEGAKGQGISEKDMQDEVGDLTEYVRDKLRAAKKAEDDRTDRRK
jgi:hypothetical protein